MKSKIIFILIIFLLIIKAQLVTGETSDWQQSKSFGMNYEFSISEPFSDEIPSDRYIQGMYRANEWGGEDAPGPEDPQPVEMLLLEKEY